MNVPLSLMKGRLIQEQPRFLCLIKRREKNLLGERNYQISISTEDNRNINDIVEDETEDILEQFMELRSFFVDNVVMVDFCIMVGNFLKRKPLTDWERKLNQVIMKRRDQKESPMILSEKHTEFRSLKA